MDFLLNNAPNWAIGICLVLLVLREVYITIYKKDIARTAIEKYQDIYYSIDKLEQTVNASRVTILKAHDSGKPLDGLNKLFSSVVASTAKNERLRNLNKKWVNVEVDTDYIEAIKEIFTNKVIRIDTDKLPKGSILHDLYESDGIKCSYVCLIKINTTQNIFKRLFNKPEVFEFAYISVHFTDNITDYSTIREAIRTTATEIKTLLRG